MTRPIDPNTLPEDLMALMMLAAAAGAVEALTISGARRLYICFEPADGQPVRFLEPGQAGMYLVLRFPLEAKPGAVRVAWQDGPPSLSFL